MAGDSVTSRARGSSDELAAKFFAVPALARTPRGRNRVARTLINWLRRVARLPGVSLRPVGVNDGPGVLVRDAQQRVISVWSLEISGCQIRSIGAIVNPDKLAHVGPLADLQSLLKSAR